MDREVMHLFLNFTVFYKQRQAETGKKNQANPKQHPEAKLLLFENYSNYSPRHHPKIMGHIKKKPKKKYACFMRWRNRDNNEKNIT